MILQENMMTPPFIENCSAEEVRNGKHFDPGENSMLISIADPAGFRPVPKHVFKEVHEFEFLDLEKDDVAIEADMKITNAQAAEIVRLLQHALDNRMQVVVHCMMGVCRSGAVADVGVMMGFQDAERWRSPNLLVKHKLLRVMGMLYDEQEEIKYSPYLNNKTDINE